MDKWSDNGKNEGIDDDSLADRQFKMNGAMGVVIVKVKKEEAT